MSTGPGRVRIRRIYDDPSPDDGRRVLVDRLWPRGVSRERAHLDGWCRHVSPTPGLRRWYGHHADRFEEFSRRYRAELCDGEQAEALDRLRRLAESGTVTLLTATRDPGISAAAVLAEEI